LLGHSVDGLPGLGHLELPEVVLAGGVQVHFVFVDDFVLFFDIESLLGPDILDVVLLVVVVLLVIRSDRFGVRILDESVCLSLPLGSLFRSHLGERSGVQVSSFFRAKIGSELS